MTAPQTIRTPRLMLRPWRDDDLPPFAAMNADARVMEFFPKPLDRPESDLLADRIRDHFARLGFGFWAVEVPGLADFIGFVGLAVPRFETHFTPCVEIGWRLAYSHWGFGYATEAALAALDFGFRQLALEEIVSFTVPVNLRSSARHGANRHDPRPSRRFRSSVASRRTPPPSACPLPPCEMRRTSARSVNRPLSPMPTRTTSTTVFRC